MAGCLFCGVVAGEVPAFRVADTPDGVAFLDIRPVFKGHVLVVPRPHVDDLESGHIARHDAAEQATCHRGRLASGS